VTPNVQTGYGLEQMGGQILQKYYEIWRLEVWLQRLPWMGS
jgi:hypothetical protein